MTSAALADCSGATSDSASKARTKRTVFMEITPVLKRAFREQGFQHQPSTQYRPRMNYLRRADCCHAAKPADRVDREHKAPAKNHPAAHQPCFQRGTTAVASISTRAAFSTRRATSTSAMAG